mmetsp:Transcript_7537/g.22455  ORF Transcript_7537/g.22455 Transcript_7537/m.22455 type:complete len:223 (+) Transcript_7537:392-1060(+)
MSAASTTRTGTSRTACAPRCRRRGAATRRHRRSPHGSVRSRKSTASCAADSTTRRATICCCARAATLPATCSASTRPWPRCPRATGCARSAREWSSTPRLPMRPRSRRAGGRRRRTALGTNASSRTAATRTPTPTTCAGTAARNTAHGSIGYRPAGATHIAGPSRLRKQGGAPSGDGSTRAPMSRLAPRPRRATTQRLQRPPASGPSPWRRACPRERCLQAS